MTVVSSGDGYERQMDLCCPRLWARARCPCVRARCGNRRHGGFSRIDRSRRCCPQRILPMSLATMPASTRRSRRCQHPHQRAFSTEPRKSLRLLDDTRPTPRTGRHDSERPELPLGRTTRPSHAPSPRKRSELAPTATAPGPAAASAAATARTTSPTTSARAAPAAAAAAPPPIGNFFTDLRCRGVFLVEDVERRQTDVGDFLFTEKDFVIR
jgi:hypothetical protein